MQKSWFRKHFGNKAYFSEYYKTGTRAALDMQTSRKIIYDSPYQYIAELVNQLSGRRKEIFIKSSFEGHSIVEIAEELQISHKTVENQLTGALQFIRTNLYREIINTILFLALFIS